MTFYSRPPTPSQAHPPIEIIVRCAPGADEWLAIVGPNGTRGVFVVSVRELRSHHRFSIATLERCWPPVLLSRAQWQTLFEQRILTANAPERNRGLR